MSTLRPAAGPRAARRTLNAGGSQGGAKGPHVPHAVQPATLPPKAFSQMTPAASTFFAKHLDRTGGGTDSDRGERWPSQRSQGVDTSVPSRILESATMDILTQLARIEAQNLEILSLLTARKANKRFLPVEEAAERLDRSAWTIRQLCARGQIRAVKDEGGCWRIPTDEVARLEENGVPKLPKR